MQTCIEKTSTTVWPRSALSFSVDSARSEADEAATGNSPPTAETSCRQASPILKSSSSRDSSSNRLEKTGVGSRSKLNCRFVAISMSVVLQHSAGFADTSESRDVDPEGLTSKSEDGLCNDQEKEERVGRAALGNSEQNSACNRSHPSSCSNLDLEKNHDAFSALTRHHAIWIVAVEN